MFYIYQSLPQSMGHKYWPTNSTFYVGHQVVCLTIKVAKRINFIELSFSQASDLWEERGKSREVEKNNVTFLKWKNKNI